MELMEINIELIQEKLKKILDELNVGIYEKERSIRLTLLSVLAGESIFLLGEPGTAKSLIARRISEAFGIQKEDFFCYLMNHFSQPDEVFGPVSIQKLKNDEYERKTEGYLPKAKFAFLDEIWKANPAIQNALLTILNEREFRNNGKNEKTCLIGFVSASNKLPAEDQVESIFDRFLVRVLERPIEKNSDSFRNMISDSKELSPLTEKITLEEVKYITEKAKDVKLSDECYNIIKRIGQITSEQNEHIEDNKNKWFISDRRWKKIVNLMRVSALCNGRTETNIMDASIIADCIWKNESQEEFAKAIVKEAIENYGLECKTNFDDVKQDLTEFEKHISNTFFHETRVIIASVKEIETINGHEFYVVIDSYNHKHKISIESYTKPSDAYSRYYFDGTYNSINGYWQGDKFIEYPTDSEYTISYSPASSSIKVLRKPDLHPKEEAGKIVIENFNERYYKVLDNKLKNYLASIEKQIEECIQKYNNNLFADNDFFLSAIATKLTASKVQINDLIAKLKEQKERYDISK